MMMTIGPRTAQESCDLNAAAGLHFLPQVAMHLTSRLGDSHHVNPKYDGMNHIRSTFFDPLAIIIQAQQMFLGAISQSYDTESLLVKRQYVE